jgi:hypothetical protein
MPRTVDPQQIGSYTFVRAVTSGRNLYAEYRLEDGTEGREEYDGDDEIGDPREWDNDQAREMACFLLGIDKKYASKVQLLRH